MSGGGHRDPVGSRFRGNDVSPGCAWGGATRRVATLTPALSLWERESNLRALAGAGPTLTPALSQRERESNILPSFPRRRESRRREAPLLSYISATSFPRRREPTAPHAEAP